MHDTGSQWGRPGVRKLLIVDDDADFRKLVTTVATEMGFEVMGIGAGDEAEDAQRSFLPDVILVDMVMPGLDGIEVVRKMVSAAIEARIILVSGYSQSYMNAARAIATASGVDTVRTVTKPFALDELRALLAA